MIFQDQEFLYRVVAGVIFSLLFVVLFGSLRSRGKKNESKPATKVAFTSAHAEKLQARIERLKQAQEKKTV
jgi:hypothetical protein